MSAKTESPSYAYILSYLSFIYFPLPGSPSNDPQDSNALQTSVWFWVSSLAYILDMPYLSPVGLPRPPIYTTRLGRYRRARIAYGGVG